MADLDTSSEGHGKKKGGVRSKKMSTKIDMTPMVDLAFLLVTFFMLTTSLAKPSAMDLIMPDKKKLDDPTETKVKLSEAMNIIIAQKNRIFYYTLEEGKDPQPIQSNYSANGIRKVIMDFDEQVKSKQAADKKKGAVFLIKAIEDSEYGHVVDVLDEMKITKAQRYAIVPPTPEEIAMLPKDTLQ
jgi:biopolymer transport protein ExbD